MVIVTLSSQINPLTAYDRGIIKKTPDRKKDQVSDKQENGNARKCMRSLSLSSHRPIAIKRTRPISAK